MHIILGGGGGGDFIINAHRHYYQPTRRRRWWWWFKNFETRIPYDSLLTYLFVCSRNNFRNVFSFLNSSQKNTPWFFQRSLSLHPSLNYLLTFFPISSIFLHVPSSIRKTLNPTLLFFIYYTHTYTPENRTKIRTKRFFSLCFTLFLTLFSALFFLLFLFL